MTEKSPQETQQENIYWLIFGSFLQKYYLKTETSNKKDDLSHCLPHMYSFSENFPWDSGGGSDLDIKSPKFKSMLREIDSVFDSHHILVTSYKCNL